MSNVLDFFFESEAPPNVTSSGVSVQTMPRWMSDYAQNLLSGATAVGQEGYQPYGGPRLAGLNADQLQAMDVTRNQVGQTPAMIGAAAAQPGALTAAQPLLNQAGKTFPQSATQYMNPYIENVTNRNAQLTQRALNERLLPSVSAKFGNAQQDSRSSAYRRAVDMGTRDLAEGLNAQNLADLSHGYEVAGNQFNADANRAGNLAGVTGQLASNERGQNVDIAGQLQDASLRDAAGLEKIGATQQADTQASLDLAKNDFDVQRDYPRQNIDWLNSVMRGVPYDQARSTTESEPLPGSTYGPTRAGQIGSLVELLRGGKKRGGHIMFHRGGATRYIA